MIRRLLQGTKLIIVLEHVPENLTNVLAYDARPQLEFMLYHLARKEDGTCIIRRHIQEFGHLLHHAICRPIGRTSTSSRQLDVAQTCNWAYPRAYIGS